MDCGRIVTTRRGAWLAVILQEVGLKSSMSGRHGLRMLEIGKHGKWVAAVTPHNFLISRLMGSGYFVL